MHLRGPSPHRTPRACSTGPDQILQGCAQDPGAGAALWLIADCLGLFRDRALLFLFLIPLCGVACLCPSSLATGEARTLWPGSQGPRPQFQVETVLFLGTCQWLPALPEHPGPWPRTGAKKGSTALSDSLLSLPMRPCLRLENPSACPSWSLPGARNGPPSGCSWAPGLASRAAFDTQLWPPPFLSAQCPWCGRGPHMWWESTKRLCG